MEKSSGSQKLWTFLIPISETKNRTSATVQQTTPDYDYVVVVNSIVDPSPQKISGDKSLTDKVKPVVVLDRNPSFHGESPLSHLGSKDELRYSQASHSGKKVLNTGMSPAESHSFSTKPAQLNNLQSGVVHWHEDSYDNYHMIIYMVNQIYLMQPNYHMIIYMVNQIYVGRNHIFKITREIIVLLLLL